MCPLQSIPVTYTRDRCAYVVDFTLYTVESTAFGRQGPEVQILSPRPLVAVVSMSCGSRSRLRLAGVALWHREEYLWPRFEQGMAVITSK